MKFWKALVTGRGCEGLRFYFQKLHTNRRVRQGRAVLHRRLRPWVSSVKSEIAFLFRQITSLHHYIYVHTTHHPWAVDTNLLPGAPIQSGVRGANGLPTNGLPFQNWGALVCAANPGQCFADSSRTILQNNEYESVSL